jgi:hypothetical protein
MTATRAENSQPTASIPALGFGVRAWCKSVIETSHATASPSINKIPRFFFDSFSDSAGEQKQALTFAAKQQHQTFTLGSF